MGTQSTENITLPHKDCLNIVSVWAWERVKVSVSHSLARQPSCSIQLQVRKDFRGQGQGGLLYGQTSRYTPNHIWLANKGVLIMADSFLCKPGNHIFSTSVNLQYHRLVLIKPMGIYIWHRSQGSNIGFAAFVPAVRLLLVNDDTPLRGGLFFLSTCFSKETKFLNSGRRHQPTI